MGEVLAFIKPKPKRKGRILRRKERLADSLVMEHADCGDAGMPCDSPYSAPDSDPA